MFFCCECDGLWGFFKVVDTPMILTMKKFWIKLQNYLIYEYILQFSFCMERLKHGILVA